MGGTWKWPGSRWWRVDLHAHSPSSYDFGRQPDRDNPDWVRWLESARDADIDAIAITDHNTAIAIDHLQRTDPQVEGAPTIYPGTEITASDRTHLLFLMDPSCTKEHVEYFLSTINIPVDGRGRDTARSSKSVEDILKCCRDDALILGAHVNGPKGLLEMDGQQRIAVLRHQRLAAVEIDPGESLDASWVDGSRPQIGRGLSQVWSSDSHNFTEFGRRYTWVKMTAPNLEGLRLALLDGPSSLKPAYDGDVFDPNTHAELAIEEVVVRKAKYMGQAEPMTVEFNPWLNTIIGGRGTGKSTLVDLCRQTLRRESELDGSDSDEEGSLRSVFDRRLRVPESRGSEGLLTDETSVQVIYRKYGDRFAISWRQNGVAEPVVRLDGDKRIPEGGDVRERFPVRIFSQKQLFALAQNPNALLAVIDDSPKVRQVERRRALDRLEARYLSLRAEARAALRQADDLPTQEASSADVQRKLEILQEGDHAHVLKMYRMLRQQDDTWQEVLRAASQAVESVGQASADLLVDDLEIDIGIADDPAVLGLRRAHDALKQSIGTLQQDVVKGVDRVVKEIERIQTGDDAVVWLAAVDQSEERFHELSLQLAKQGIPSPNEYTNLLEQAANLRRQIESLENEKRRSEQLEHEADNVLTEYRRKREELSEKRQDFAKETSGDTIEVRVSPLRQYGSLTSELSGILGTDRFGNDRQAIAQRIQPGQGDQWDWDRLDEMVSQIRKFCSGEVDSWPARDARFNGTLKDVPPERIDRLALYAPEDAVAVRFHDHQAREWRSLAQGSPGQQTAALLAFVLGDGTEPIILDQPEYDLDNTLIYELLVRRFRETKQNRQVIVVTHNPNIVVHGDAELVLSLRAANGRSEIECRGGLQERHVRDEICRVMEGGREAFESRYQRIIAATG